MKQIEISDFGKMNPQAPQFSSKNQNYLVAGANPIYYLDNGLQEEQVSPLAASLDWSKLTPDIIDSYPSSNFSYAASKYPYPWQYQGQSFHNTNSVVLSGVQLYLKKTGTPTGTLTVQIWSHTGTYGSTGVPGTLLATSDTLSIASLNTLMGLGNFVFSGLNKITLAANTNYCLVLSYGSLTQDASNYVSLGIDNTSPTPNGNTFSSSDEVYWGSTTSYALIFYVYGGFVGLSLDGNIVHMISNTSSSPSAFAITDTTHVYGVSPTGITDLGYISGSTVSNAGGYLAIGGSYLFATYSLGGIYKYPLGGGSWSLISGATLTAAVGVHIMEPFLDFIAILDGSVSYAQGNLVRKLDVGAFTLSSGINLGTGWGTMQIRNLNNKYLAIAAGKTGAGGNTTGYSQNYIYLWNGITSTYNYAIKVPGKFIDMKVVDSVLYVAVQVSVGKTCLYYLNGTKLTKIITTQYSTINQAIYAPVPCSLFDFKNNLGIHLDNTTDFNDPIMLYGKEDMGQLEFIHTSGYRFDQFCVGYDGNLFASCVPNIFTPALYYLPTSGTYQQVTYKSQWIPVKNLQALDIYYETPPQSGTDAINVTIYGSGEDIINGNSTTVLNSITPTNYLNKKRTRLDCQGFTGDQVMIKLTTINSAWQPIIRKIRIITE